MRCGLRVARLPRRAPWRRWVPSAIGGVYWVEAGATTNATLPGWASVLGITPPFSTEQVRAAYRSQSKAVHPDIGGSQAAFVCFAIRI